MRTYKQFLDYGRGILSQKSYHHFDFGNGRLALNSTSNTNIFPEYDFCFVCFNAVFIVESFCSIKSLYYLI